MMCEKKQNRKSKVAKKFLVVTLALSLIVSYINLQKLPSVYVEAESKKSFTDEQGIEYYSKDGETCNVKSGAKVTQENIVIPATVEYDGTTYSVKRISVGAFAGNEAIETVEIENGIKAISTVAFGGCKNLQSVTIPDSVKTMGVSMFSYCINLTDVTLGENIKGIEMTTFYDCSSLQSIEIPEGVKYIGAGAFKGCDLQSVTIPKNVTKIEKLAFKCNPNLKSITIKSTSLNRVDKNAIKKIHKKVTIKVPEKKLEDYKKLFNSKTGYKETMKIKKNS